MYLTNVAELDAALVDCWRRLSQARDAENVEAVEVYLAQLDRLLDMRLRLAAGDRSDQVDGPLVAATGARS